MSAWLTRNRAGVRQRFDFTNLRSVILAKVGLTLLPAVLQLLVARTLGPEQFGLYASTVALVTPLTAVATIGFQQTVLRFASQLRARGNRRGIAQLTSLAIASTVAVGTLLLLAIVLIDLEGHIVGNWNLLVLGGLLVPLGSVSLLLCSLLRAFELPLIAMLPEALFRSLGLAIVLGAGMGGLLSPNATHLLLATVFSLIVSVLWSSWRAWTVVVTTPQRSFDNVINSTLFRATGYAFLLLVANAIATRAIAALLASLLPPQEFAAYAVATRLADLLGVPAWGVAMVVAPRFASLVAEQTAGEGPDLLWRSRRAATLLSAGPILLTLAFAEPLLGIVGPSYIAAAPVLRILALKVVVLAMIGPTLAAITMIGGERCAALLMTVFGTAGVGLTYMLTEYWGASGGALGQSGVEIAVAMACLHSLRKRFSSPDSSLGSHPGAGEIR